MMDNQVDKEMAHEMGTGVIQGLHGNFLKKGSPAVSKNPMILIVRKILMEPSLQARTLDSKHPKAPKPQSKA